jgi:hypothetical protein
MHFDVSGVAGEDTDHGTKSLAINQFSSIKFSVIALLGKRKFAFLFP